MSSVEEFRRRLSAAGNRSELHDLEQEIKEYKAREDISGEERDDLNDLLMSISTRTSGCTCDPFKVTFGSRRC